MKTLHMSLDIPIKRWRSDAILPCIASEGDAGSDCYINIFKKIIDSAEHKLEELSDNEYTLEPGERILCGLGFATAIPYGYYAAVVPRSGLALWDGITIANTPGTVDAGYRNEWGAIVINLSKKPVTLKKNQKICQFIIRKFPKITLNECEELPDSERGLRGYGSTGKH